MNDTLASIAECNSRTIKITGPVASGKTQALIDRCCALLAQGADPKDVLVTCTTSFAVHAFEQRLAAALGANAARTLPHLRICTPMEVILATLNQPEVSQRTGRSGRLLSPFEYNFVLEDMKTLGQPRRELRNMLSFLYRNWAQVAPEAEWKYGDIVEIANKLQGMCATMNGFSKYEAPYLCATFLKSDEGEPYRAAYGYMLCDDFQNMSYAEQIALCLHAKHQLIVAGNTSQWSKAASEHPFAKGFENFEKTRRNVEVFHLEPAPKSAEAAAIQKIAAVLDVAKASGAAGAAGAAQGTAEGSAQGEAAQASGTPAQAVQAASETAVHSLKWVTPEDELVGLTKILRKRFSEDAALLESSCCVIAPNKKFARLYQRALEQRGFKTSLSGMGSGIGGDPRNTKTCPALFAYVKLNLVAHPTDSIAWRAWCGFNDALCNSQSFEGLYDYAQAKNLTLAEALAEVSKTIAAGGAEPFLRAGVLSSRYEQGQALISKNANRRGFAALEALGAAGLAEFAAVEEQMGGTETVQELFALARQSVFAPRLSNNPHVMNIMSYTNMAGLSFDAILAVGLVDGYMPNRNAFEVVSTEEARAAVLVSEQRAFYSAVGKARKELTLSHFTKCDLELAERTKMQVSRVRSEKGARIALARPSCFFTEMEQACPSTLSGQAYLSQLGL